MYTYVFIFRFWNDALHCVRRLDIEAMSAASAHAKFYELLAESNCPALERGTFKLMAELSEMGRTVLISETLRVITFDHKAFSR